MSDERAVTRPVVNVNEPLPDDPGVADRWALICGESLTDLMPSDERGEAWRAVPGGSPFNTALALARLGMPTSLLQPGFPRRPGQTGDRTVGAGGGGPELCAAHIAANDDWSHEEPPARKEDRSSSCGGTRRSLASIILTAGFLQARYQRQYDVEESVRRAAVAGHWPAPNQVANRRHWLRSRAR